VRRWNAGNCPELPDRHTNPAVEVGATLELDDTGRHPTAPDDIRCHDLVGLRPQ
jgi:hypothetical protein